MSLPSSQIYICSGVPLDAHYEHTIVFDTPEKQLEYFAGKVVKTFSNYTYLRKSWEIKVNAQFENAREWCYLYFRNTETGKHWFYFINSIEYENDNVVRLTLELDVMQTYMFDYSLSQCFIERQHTASDNIGEHTVDEGLDLGDLCTSDKYAFAELNDLCILVYTTFNPNAKIINEAGETTYAPIYGSTHDRTFSGMGIYAVATTDAVKLGEKLTEFSADGVIDGVVNMFMYPKALVNLGDYSASQAHTWTDGIVFKNLRAVNSLSISLDKREYLTGKLAALKPKNKKLLGYPFNFLYVTNHAGAAASYHYEWFDGSEGKCQFKVYGSYSPDGGVRLVPTNYNGESSNYDEGLTLGTFPTCAWAGDMYKLWLAQNQHSNNAAFGGAFLTIAGGTVAAAVGAVTLNPMAIAGGVGAMLSGGHQVQTQLAAIKDASIQPPQARGAHSVSVNVANNLHTFEFIHKCVTYEKQQILDEYFTRYGYKINRIQVPNIKARPFYTYVKTIECHLLNAAMCTEDRLKIQSIYDKGITFWRDADKVCDYTVDNSPT